MALAAKPLDSMAFRIIYDDVRRKRSALGDFATEPLWEN
jgi:hypothetical protein